MLSRSSIPSSDVILNKKIDQSEIADGSRLPSNDVILNGRTKLLPSSTPDPRVENNSNKESSLSYEEGSHLPQPAPKTIKNLEVDESNQTFEPQTASEVEPSPTNGDGRKQGDDVSPSGQHCGLVPTIQPPANSITKPEVSEEIRYSEELERQSTGGYEFGEETIFQEFDNKLGQTAAKGQQNTEESLGAESKSNGSKSGLADVAKASTSELDFGNASWELPFSRADTVDKAASESIVASNPVVEVEKETAAPSDKVKLKSQEEPAAAAGLFFGDKTPAFAISTPKSKDAQGGFCPKPDSVSDEAETLECEVGQNGPKVHEKAPMKRTSSFEFGDTPNIFDFGSSGVSVVQSSKPKVAGPLKSSTAAPKERNPTSRSAPKSSPKRTGTFNFGSGSPGSRATDFFKYYSEDNQTHPVVQIPSSQFQAKSAESADAFFSNIPTPPYTGTPLNSLPMANKTPMSHSRSATTTPAVKGLEKGSNFSFDGGNARPSPTVAKSTIQSGPNIVRQSSKMFDFASPEAQPRKAPVKYPIHQQTKGSLEATRNNQPPGQRGTMPLAGLTPRASQPFTMPHSMELSPRIAKQPERKEQSQRRQPWQQLPSETQSTQENIGKPLRDPTGPPIRQRKAFRPFPQSSVQKPNASYSHPPAQNSGQFQQTAGKKPAPSLNWSSNQTSAAPFPRSSTQEIGKGFPQPFVPKPLPSYQKPTPVQSFQQPPTQELFHKQSLPQKGHGNQNGYANIQGQYAGTPTQAYTQPTAFQQPPAQSTRQPVTTSRFQGSTASFTQTGTSRAFQQLPPVSSVQKPPDPNHKVHGARNDPPSIRQPAQHQNQFYNPVVPQPMFSPEERDGGGTIDQTTHPVQAEVPSPHYGNNRLPNYGGRPKIEQTEPMMDVPLNGQQLSSPFPTHTEQYRPPPPHPTISFSLGGSLAVVYPEGSRNEDQLHVVSGNDGCRAAPSGKTVRIYNTKSIALDAIVAAEIDEFPGPIASASTKEIEKFFQNLPQYTSGMEETRKMLWNVLGVYAKFTGAELREKVVKILLEGGAPSEHECYQDPPKEVSLSKDLLDRTNDYLSQGLSHQGCSLLMSHSASAPALLLAMGLAHNNPELRTQALEAITVPLGPSTPLFALCWVHAGAAQHLIKKEAYMDALVSNWKRNLASLFQASGQGGTTGPMAVVVMRELGDRLWLRQKQVFAAQLCYLCAGEALETQPRKDPRLLLLGGDHINNSASAFLSYGTTHDAIHMTEIYEYVKSGKDKNFILPYFQKCKLAHAKKLAAFGLPGRALKYCKSIQGIGSKRPNDTTCRAILAEVSDLIKHLSMAHFGTAEGLSQSVIGTVASAVTSGVTTGLSTGFSWLVGGTSKVAPKTDTPTASTDSEVRDNPSIPPRPSYRNGGRNGGRTSVRRLTNGSNMLRASTSSPMPPLSRTESARPISAPHPRTQQRTLRRGQSMRQIPRSSSGEVNKSNIAGAGPAASRPPQRIGSSPSLASQDRSAMPDGYSSTSRLQALVQDPPPRNVQPAKLPPGNPKSLKVPPGSGTRPESALPRRPLSRVSSAGRHRPRPGRRTSRPRT